MTETTTGPGLVTSSPSAGLPVSALRPEPAPEDNTPFCRLLGKGAWTQLAPAIRRRFGLHLAPHESITYQGIIVETRMGLTGWLLAQLGRLAGAPLPLDKGNGGTAAVVTVTEMPRDRQGRGGQYWTRVYGREGRFPQIIRSVKRFAGRTGLIEQVCGGLGISLAMSLRLKTTPRKLIFHSADYFLQLGRLTLKLPRLVTPGRLTVVHEDLDDGWFSFELSIRHPIAGDVLYQKSVFTDPAGLQGKEALNG